MRVVVWPKTPLRIAFAAATVLLAIFLFAGRAHADEATPPPTTAQTTPISTPPAAAPPPDGTTTPPSTPPSTVAGTDPSTPTSTPAPTAATSTPTTTPPAAAPPPDDTTTPPSTSATTSPSPTTSPSDGSGGGGSSTPSDPGPTATPADTGTSTEPSSPGASDLATPSPEQATGDPPTGASGTTTDPTGAYPDTSQQQASVDSTGIAVATTGADATVGSGESTPGTSGTTSGSGTAGTADSGTAASTPGSDTATSTTPAGGTSTSPTGSTDPTAATSTTPSGDATVTAGDATSSGVQGDSTISQGVVAHATDAGQVDVLQVALVVDVGVSYAGSGDNAAVGAATASPSAGAAPPAGDGTLATGDASAQGNDASTQLTQYTEVGNGQRSTQVATVIDLGLAVGNTGLNVTIGSLSVDGVPVDLSAVDQAPTGSAAITSGPAGSQGDVSSSDIAQRVVATAADQGVLHITQQAIVLNLGVALANTGGNVAAGTATLDSLPPQVRDFVESLLGALLSPLSASQADAGPSTPSSGGTAGVVSVQTGRADALGNRADTSVHQTAVGTATGTGRADASQTAVVGNLGIALANSGWNVGAGALTLPPGGGSALTSAESSLTAFLQALLDPAAVTSNDLLHTSLDLGPVTLTLRGGLDASSFVVGWDPTIVPDAPFVGGIRVRQITGVLHLGISIADTGRNLAVGVITDGAATDRSTRAAPGAGGATLSVSSLATSGAPGSATLRTGDARALGNHVVVLICQTHGAFDACAPAPLPAPEPVPSPTPAPEPTPTVQVAAETTPPAVVPATTADAPAAISPTITAEPGTEALPFTGGELEREALAGLGLLAIGGLAASGELLPRRRRRRRGER